MAGGFAEFGATLTDLINYFGDSEKKQNKEEEKMKYFDKSGNSISAGDFVKFPDGSIQQAVVLGSGLLGYCEKNRPDAETEYYTFPSKAEHLGGEWVFIVDCLICDDPAETAVKEKLMQFIVEITEITKKRVIAWAADKGAAESGVENLCDAYEIEMDRNIDFRRDVTAEIAAGRELPDGLPEYTIV